MYGSGINNTIEAILGILTVAVIGCFAIALCHPPFRNWLFEPLRQMMGRGDGRRPKP